MAKVPQRQFFLRAANAWISDGLARQGCPRGELGLGSVYAGTSWALTRKFNYHHFSSQYQCGCSNHTLRSLKTFRVRRKPTDWQRSEECGGEKGGVWQEDAAGHTQPPVPPLSDISEQSCLAGCLVRPTAVPTAALCHPAVSRPLQNYSALRLTWQTSLFSAAGLKYLL